MPTERFARLPSEKKKSIFQAALAEFSRVPFEKASINKIIKNADISRGSFYTYFEDKRDLLEYVFEDFLEKGEEILKKSFLEHHGNYWNMMEGFSEFMKEEMSEEWKDNLKDIVRIAIFQTDTESLMGKCIGPECSPHQTLEKWIYENGDWTDMRRQDFEFVRTAVALGIQMLLIALGQMFKEPERTEEICRIFKDKIEILRWGACVSGMEKKEE